MVYGIVLDVPAPIEFYDALHAAIGRRGGHAPDGLLLHVGRATDGGFQVMEVWESEEQCDRFNADVVGPSLAELSDRQPTEGPEVATFEPRGLIIPAASLLV
jgi:hypothetical protein